MKEDTETEVATGLEIVLTEEEKIDNSLALMTLFVSRTMKCTNEKAYRRPDVDGNIFPPFKRDFWIDDFVSSFNNPVLM